MASFRLSNNTMLLLQKRFQEFTEARMTVHANIQAYINSYQNFTGKRSDRQAELEKEYMPRSPHMGWLIFREGKDILWQENDIAVLMGRSQASISRVLDRMEHSLGWCSRLLALSEETKSANNVTITAYHEGIFDLIFDKYEDEYLSRFIQPRRGSNPPDAEEVMRFWEYLKEDSALHSEYTSDLPLIADDAEKLPEITRLGAGDIFSLIFRRILTPKTGLLFTVMFALSFEIVRRWHEVMAVIFAHSLVALSACMILLHMRKYRVSLLSDAGAVSALMSVFWGLGLLSGGYIYTPGGNALALGKEHPLTLEPELMGKRVVFRVMCESYGDIKEIFCRTDLDREYFSTGFNDYGFPDPFIEPDRLEGMIRLDVKYLDKDNKEHGPFTFSYDMDTLSQDLSKKAVISSNWLYVSRIAGNASVNVYLNSDAADSVVYGINTDEPHTSCRVRAGSSTIITMKNANLDYVSAYLVFKDGTSSDIRRAE
ncbi:MAG: hypothetical protein IJS28_09270 [Synergistaceae bacterium]|nr:hypothetical protein [Synergistaceae bacterium]